MILKNCLIFFVMTRNSDKNLKKLKNLQHIQVMLKELAIVCERYEVSDRAGAATASATLKAFGIVAEEDKRYVVNKSKLQREGKKYKEEIRNKEQELLELVDSIFVDGRKDATMTMVVVN